MIKEEVKNIAAGTADAGLYLAEKGLSQSTFFKDSAQLASLLSFFEDKNSNFCEITGTFGTFKSKLAEISLHLLDENVLIFRYECFEGTTLDDIFLALFADLRAYYQMGKIAPAKIETTSLTKKINQYLSHINLPAVFVFDSFENLNANPENQEEISRFVKHLAGLNKFKIVVLSRKSENWNIENARKIELEPFNRLQLALYLEASHVKAEQDEIYRLFEATQGNTSQISLTVNMISILKTGLKDFIEEFEAKKTSYGNFLLQKLSSFVPEKLKKSVSVLALAKTGFSPEFLVSAGLFTPEQLNYLIERNILSCGGGYVYMKGYLKTFWLSSVSLFEKQEIHQYLRDFFESQLPLKPGQRVMPLSRTTMREQSAYHASFLSEKPRETPDIAYLGYISGNLAEWTTPEKKNEPKTRAPHKPREQESKKSLEKYELTKEELALLGLPVDLSSGTVPAAARVQVHQEEIVPEKSSSEFFDEGLAFQQKHEYQNAIDAYDAAISGISTAGDEIVPDIFENASECAQKLNKIDEAVKYLDSLYDFYYEKGKNELANGTLLKIARLYKDSYRFLKARDIYERFLSSKLPVSAAILANAHIGLAQIAEDSSDVNLAREHYRKAFSLINPEEKGENLSEAYFKYALMLDDENDSSNALEYYKKSISACDDLKKNPYLSAAYTNIAEIYSEAQDYKNAFRNFALALKIDSELQNYDGIYYLSSKLAKVSQKVKPELVLNFILKALGAAKRLQDRFYMVNSYLEAGDYYFSRKDFAKSLKAYFNARNVLLKGSFEKADLQRIDKKLDNLKNSLSPAEYERILKGFKK